MLENIMAMLKACCRWRRQGSGRDCLLLPLLLMMMVMVMVMVMQWSLLFY